MKSRWQVAFLVGWAVSVGALALVFGVSVVTGLAALVGIVLSGVNALVTPSGDRSRDSGVAVARLKAILNVSSYLKVLTVLLWTFGFAIAALGIWREVRLSRLIVLKGAVQTPRGEIAPGARITLDTAEGPVSIISQTGEFAFSGVDSAALPGGSIGLRVEWRGRTAHFRFPAKSDGGLLLRLDAADLPLRLTLRELPESEVRVLIGGRVSDALAKKLGGQPFIIPTPVFDTAKRLFERGDIVYDMPRTLSAREVSALLNAGGWNYLSAGVRDGLVWRPLKSMAASPTVPLPGAPMKLWISSIDTWGGCGGDEEQRSQRPFVLTTVGRPVTMKLVVVENTQAVAVRLGDFSVHKVSGGGFRSREEETLRMEQSGAEDVRLFPMGILQPGEKILLPTELTFGFGRHVDEDPAEHSRFQKLLESRSSPVYPLDLGGDRVDVRRSVLLEMLRQPGGAIVAEYVFGPSLSLNGLDIDGVRYPWPVPEAGQQTEPARYVMLQGDALRLPKTSCPFLYTRASNGGPWRKVGHILSNRMGKSSEGTDTRRIQAFAGRILLREEETEVTFIDAVFVRSITGGRVTAIAYAKSPLLNRVDGRYVRLGPGEEIEVVFDEPVIGAEDASYEVGVVGYYVPVLTGEERDR